MWRAADPTVRVGLAIPLTIQLTGSIVQYIAAAVPVIRHG
jgi:hypothetical protein